MTTSTTDQPTLSASAFVSSIGVNTHVGYSWGSYNNLSLVVDDLKYLGVTTLRDGLATSPSAQPVLDGLAAAGYKFDFVIPSSVPASGGAGLQAYIVSLEKFETSHPDSIIALEGLNEADIQAFSYNGSSSIAAAAQFQAAFYTAVKGDAEISNISVYNLSLSYNDQAAYNQLGDLSAYSDYANAHSYVSTSSITAISIAGSLATASTGASANPLVITETGYTTEEGTAYIGADESVQARSILNTLVDAYKAGVSTTYLYELLDRDSSSTNTDPEANFGLFHADGTPKLAATAIHNLTTILSDDGAGGHQPTAALGYSLGNMPTNGGSMVLGKSNGAYDLVVWAEPKIWNDATDTEIVNPTQTVTVHLDAIHHSIKVYDPLTGTTPIAVYTDVSDITVPITDHPLIIEIDAPETSVVPPATATDVSGTAVEIVAQLSDLNASTTLQTITLTDSHTLPVASESTMTYIISHYGNALAAIQGGYSFSVTMSTDSWSETRTYDAAGTLTATSDSSFANGVITSKVTVYVSGATDTVTYKAGIVSQEVAVSADGSKETKSYDAAGVLTSDVVMNKDGSSITTLYSAGVKSKMYVTNADGSHDTYVYNIQGQTYTTEVQHADVAGKVTSVTRSHADGSLDYTQVLKADGTKVTTLYDATGHKTTAITATTAATTTDLYNVAGALTKEIIQKADGSVTTYVYTGAYVTTVYIVNADGSKDTKAYDTAGILTSEVIQNKDGSSSTTLYTAGVKTKMYATNADGSHDTYAYNIKGQSYVTELQHADATGKVISVTRSHADGSLDYTQVLNADGTKVTTTYDSTGHKMAAITVTATATTTDQFNAAGALTKEIVQKADGSVTTSVYTGTVITAVYVVNADGSKDTRAFDATTGVMTSDMVQNKDGSSSTTLFTAGVKTKMYVTNADGTKDTYAYNIKGQSYVTELQHADATGKVIAVTRSHADGSLDYTQVLKADGSRVTTTYDSTGHKMAMIAVTTAATTTDQYNTAGALTKEIVQKADGSVTTSVYTGAIVTAIYLVNADGSKDTKAFDATTGVMTSEVIQNKDGSSSTTLYTAGVKTKMYVTNADGTHDTYAYNIKGQSYVTELQHADTTGKVIAVTRSHADGSLDYTQVLSSDGSRVTTTYDSTGHKMAAVTVTTAATTTDQFNTAGALIKETVQKADGSVTTAVYTGTVVTSLAIVNADGSKDTMTYDATGVLTSDVIQNKDGSSSTALYTAGIETKLYVTNADGSHDTTTFNIKSQTYVTELQHADATGKVTAVTRSHADGSLDYTQVIKADGTKVTDIYDSIGHKTSEATIHTDGSTLNLAYNSAGDLVQQVSKAADGDLTTTNYANGHTSSIYIVNADGSRDTQLFDSIGHLTSDAVSNTDGSSSTTLYTADIKTKMYVTNADGTHDTSSYNIAGQTYTTELQHSDTTGKVTAVTRSHADGSLDYTQVIGSDGTKVTDLYDSVGSKTQEIISNPTGSSEVYKYVVAGSPGAVQHESYNTSGQLTEIDLLNANGTHKITAVATGLTLIGGNGDDLFASVGSTTISFDHGNDQITNFHAGTASNHDTIKIAQSLAADYSHLQIEQSGSDALVHITATDSLVLKNVNVANLDHSNFLFA